MNRISLEEITYEYPIPNNIMKNLLIIMNKIKFSFMKKLKN